MKKSKKIIIFFLPILGFLMVWGISLAKCELLTLKYGKEFSEMYKENTMLGEQQYCKILAHSDKLARVYYVGANNSTGNVLTFQNEAGKWKYYGQWETVWSTSGSASKMIWPYWWHSVLGG